MLFLIDYNRREGRLINIRRFEDADRAAAYEARFALEKARDEQGNDHEVVLLEAPNEQVIRSTHNRYFDDDPGTIPARGATESTAK